MDSDDTNSGTDIDDPVGITAPFAVDDWFAASGYMGDGSSGGVTYDNKGMAIDFDGRIWRERGPAR